MNAKEKPVFHAVLLAGLLAATLVAPAAYPASGPGHDHGHASATTMLKLDDGRKWASDEPLRQGMTKIRDAVQAVLPAVHRERLGASGYEALGSEIDRQLAGIVQNCKLEPQADEVLHAILADMMAGNEILQGRTAKTDRAEGVVRVVRALEQYGNYFEHAGWSPPRLDH